ncbi:hypothetical protein C8Q80DRAFT_1107552, partial [Daedaleopsis nitida]
IVWWRAWVLWKESAVVRFVYVLLISAAFGELLMQVAGPVDPGNKWGLAAGTVSLFTNLTATGLIAYKAWYYRRFLKRNLFMGSARTRLERNLTLFIESGLAYCILWVNLVLLLSPPYSPNTVSTINPARFS